jgi:hypothetical protein
MGVSAGPDISSNGLLLYLDALNPSSYVSGSTIWYDISGNKNNCTLNNGPAFSTNGGVSLSFDGTDDTGTIASSSTLSVTSAVSICAWLRLGNGTNSYARFMLKNPGWDYYMGIRGSDSFTIWYSQVKTWVAGYSFVYNNGPWANVVFMYDSAEAGNNMRVYVNGVLTLQTNATGNFTAGASTFTIATSDFTGWIGNASLYNRALTAAEVTQNYKAFKNRFGL